jgi:serine/threonine protein kinase
MRSVAQQLSVSLSLPPLPAQHLTPVALSTHTTRSALRPKPNQNQTKQEYATGGSLFAYVHKQGLLKEAVARWFFQQLVVGIDYCHRRGVANRDIKVWDVAAFFVWCWS